MIGCDFACVRNRRLLLNCTDLRSHKKSGGPESPPPFLMLKIRVLEFESNRSKVTATKRVICAWERIRLFLVVT